MKLDIGIANFTADIIIKKESLVLKPLELLQIHKKILHVIMDHFYMVCAEILEKFGYTNELQQKNNSYIYNSTNL